MRKLGIGLFILCLIGLGASFLVNDPRPEFRDLNERDRFQAVLQKFSQTHQPQGSFRLAELVPYQIDPSLVDPAFTLPHEHIYPFEAIAAWIRAERECTEPPKITDSLPPKLNLWLRYKCGFLKDLPETFISTFPFMHPSGTSFAQLLAEKGLKPPQTEKYHHVLESGLTPVPNMATPTADQWRDFLSGRVMIVDQPHLWLRAPTEHDSDLVYAFYLMSDFTRFLDQRGLMMVVTESEGADANPIFRFRDDFSSTSLVHLMRSTTLIGLLILLSLAVGFLLRDRWAAQRKRAFSFQLLAHELRTPVTTLGIEIEQLLGEYDRLTPTAQKASLQLSAELARLGQMVKASDDYLRTRSAKLIGTTDSSEIESLYQFVDMVIEPLNKDIVKILPEKDQKILIDPYWLRFCVTNLLTNAIQHGTPPVRLIAEVEKRSLRLTVEDRGQGLAEDPRKIPTGGAGRAQQVSPGLGIGLQLVDRITRELGGQLLFQPRPTRWTLIFTKGVR